MSYIIPEIEGKIEKRIIFPPVNPIKIIDIHRMMIDEKIIPAMIIRAETSQMKLLRDVSIVLASQYISCDNRISYIAQYFKISIENTNNIIHTTMLYNHEKLLQYQTCLKDSCAITTPWDPINNCPLTHERIEKIIDGDLGFYFKYKTFLPSFMYTEDSVEKFQPRHNAVITDS